MRVPPADVFSDGEMSGVVSFGPLLIAVGIGGGNATVWTSSDGVRWNRNAVGDGIINGIAVGTEGLVAVGVDESGGAVWVSTDGSDWTRIGERSALNLVDATLGGVVAGGPGFVAFGWSGYASVATVWTSRDGLEWTMAAQGGEGSVFGGGDIAGMTAGGLGLVAVGQIDGEAAVWMSGNGTGWSRVALDQSISQGARMNAVALGGPGLVAVGSAGNLHDPAVWTSTDGSQWLRVRTDDWRVFGPLTTMTAVAARDGLVVAVGHQDYGGFYEARVWTSTDGVRWELETPDDPTQGPSDQFVWGVAVTDSHLVAVGHEFVDTPPDQARPAAVWIARSP